MDVKPIVTDEDHAALQRAEQIDGAHYGTRMSSMTALFALAEQREHFERQIAELARSPAPEVRHGGSTGQRTWVASLAGAVITVAIVCYWLGLVRVPPRPATAFVTPHPPASVVARKPSIVPAAYSARAARSPRQTSSSSPSPKASPSAEPALTPSSKPVKAAVEKTPAAKPSVSKSAKPVARKAQKAPPAKPSAKPAIPAPSPYATDSVIAVHLEGEALEEALAEDRRKTVTANRKQYREAVKDR